MNNELFSLGDVARLVGVKPHRIQYLLSTSAVAEPVLRVAGKRLWSADELAALSKVLTAAKGEPARRSDG